MAADEKEVRKVYFDHNATTYTRTEVVEKMMPYFRQHYGNASSLHFYGQQTRRTVDESREQVAALIGAESAEIVFTSGGTESDNIAIRGSVSALCEPGKKPHVITSDIEHPAVLRTCKSLEDDGVDVTFVPCTTDGVVRVDLIEKAFRPETVLVTIMLANNETGVLQPIEKVSRMTRERGINFHTDAVQAVGKMPVSVNELGVDLLSISAHKFYGPKGIGALYVRRGTPINPVYMGGSHEFGLRPGTENIPGIAGFGEACRISIGELPGEIERIERLRDSLERSILDRIEDIYINGADATRLPNTSSMSISRVEGEAITLNLSMLGFAVSGGSACASGENEPSHVLLAMGVEPLAAQGSIRISLGAENSDEEVEAFIDALEGIVARLRELSPIKQSH